MMKQTSSMMPILLVLLVLLVLIVLFRRSSLAKEREGAAYRHIGQQEAKEMMARDDGHVVVDVRRRDEYDAGHIPGAVLIPNESVGSEPPKELPDRGQIILVYCRSGIRAKQAAKKLAAMGYQNIYEFGGIMSWTGEIEKTGAR